MVDPHAQIQKLITNIETVIVGKRNVVELLVTGLLARGHVLIEDIPGLGKTMLARALARSISSEFRRIQFTPDLLPSDVTGVSIYNQKTSDFEFREGPIFSHIVLADEVNRTTPRTQSSLLECMQESRVTVDGTTYQLPELFMVVATQNPIEFHGTYPLPEAQIDRFLFELEMGYPTTDDEQEIVRRQMKGNPIDEIKPVLSADEIIALRKTVDTVHLDEALISYIINFVASTRKLSTDVKLGASPRASLALMRASRAYALLQGRDYVIPSDVKILAYPVLRHRMVLQPRSIARGVTTQQVLGYILNQLPAPNIT